MAISSLRYPSVCLPEEREVCRSVVCLCVCEGEVWDRVPVCLCMFLCFHVLKKVNLWKFHMVHPKRCMFQSEVMCK